MFGKWNRLHSRRDQPDDACLRSRLCHERVLARAGTAKYYDVVVDGKVNEAAAWYYPEVKEKAQNIKDFVAFWNGVKVSA